MASRANYNPGYTGFPALFFLETLYQDRGEKKIIERLWSQHARYSYLKAFLFDENDQIRKEYADTDERRETLVRRLTLLSGRIDAMFAAYDGYFEDASCSPQEKNIMQIIRGVREEIDTIAAVTKIIDGLTPTEEVMRV